MSEYRYYKRAEERDGEAWMILRESLDNPFSLECWRADRWESAIDYWWQTRQEYDYWDVSETEALSEIESLSDRQKTARENRIREEAEAREQILLERQQLRDEKARNDSWTALERSAIALHELFKTLVEAGFTEEQGLTLVSKVILGSDNSVGSSNVSG